MAGGTSFAPHLAALRREAGADLSSRSWAGVRHAACSVLSSKNSQFEPRLDKDLQLHVQIRAKARGRFVWLTVQVEVEAVTERRRIRQRQCQKGSGSGSSRLRLLQLGSELRLSGND